jgi:hypothetical protein
MEENPAAVGENARGGINERGREIVNAMYRGRGNDNIPNQGNNDEAFLSFFEDATQGNPLLGSGMVLTGNIAEDMFNYEIPNSTEGTVFLALAYTAASMPNVSVSFVRDEMNWFNMRTTIKFGRGFEHDYEEPGEVDAGNRGDGARNVIMRNETASGGFEPDWFPTSRNNDIEEYGMYNRSNINNCPALDERERFNIIFNGRTDWKQMYVDFLNAYQVKDLELRNIQSYIKWIKIVDVEGVYLCKHFPKLTGGAPKIQSNAAYRGLLREGEWTRYRSTFATIVPFSKQMIDDLPIRYKVIFSADTLRKINMAIDHPGEESYFREIPVVVFAYAYVWNQVTEQNLGGLWSGKRAYENLSLANRNSIKHVLDVANIAIDEWRTNTLGFADLKSLPAAIYDI